MTEMLIEERGDHRRAVIRSLLLYVPGGLIATGLFGVAAVSLLAGNLGAIFAAIIVGLIAFAMDYEAISALRDLRAQPTVTEGVVQRTWSKGRIAFFGRVHYLMIDRAVFEIGPVASREIVAGDRLRIEHWPHTNSVISIHRIPTGQRPPATSI